MHVPKLNEGEASGLDYVTSSFGEVFILWDSKFLEILKESFGGGGMDAGPDRRRIKMKEPVCPAT